ncbi:arylesterase [Winogradskyella forsetii]|uniref:arylesterase n=1 Tax=Winogradskyella forsetii TaxID=2686077 RepID=UPI0015BDB416|nr:arylesterase [Winogradskyella forsetii]
MLKAQNKQLRSYLPIAIAHKILKFCYFIMAISLMACGNNKSENTTPETSSTEQSEEPLTETSTTKTILCFGDSITAGMGLEDSKDAFPAVLQRKIDSLGLNYTVVNSGLSGETTAGGKSRIDWVLKQPISIFLLELGANDGLRGVTLSETRANLQAIIDEVRQKSPEIDIILAGMELPPNMGQDYTTEFRTMYRELAEKNDVEFIPFILKDVGGIAELNQSDGIHPTVEGHKIIANTVWETLEPLLKS